MTDVTGYVNAYLVSVNAPADRQTLPSVIAAEQRAQKKICKVPVVHTVLVSTTNGSPTVTATSDVFTGYDDGAAVSGEGIPDGATILSVDSNCQVTLSVPATADGDSVSLTIDPDIADLLEALARRVAANLANRNLPLGIQTQVAEFGSVANRVGGRDREVSRLEGPYRIVLV